MNAFMIPRLGSQIYAMSGMQTKLHLMASQKGKYFGQNYQYSGEGFHNMTFQAHATSQKGFDDWVEKVRQTNRRLDIRAYKQLVQPSTKNSVTYFSSVRPNLFRHVIDESNSPHGNTYHVGHRETASN